MELIALAIAPGIAICLFILHRDAYNKEPKLNLLVSFLLGAISIVPAAYIEIYLQQFLSNSITSIAISAFLVVALTEELVKFIAFRCYSYTRKSFDEPLDGIVYAVMVSMGFATLENILYVQKFGMQTGILRMFMAVPAHATFGILMGYHGGKAKFNAPDSKRLLLMGLFWAVLFHGAYDFFIFLQGHPVVSQFVSDLLLFAGAVVSLIVALRLSLRHIKAHRKLSQQTFKPSETLRLRKAETSDIPLIQKMAHEIWPVAYGSILPKEQIDYMLELIYSNTALTTQMQKGDEFILVYDEELPVGFASFGLTEPGVFKLYKLYVSTSQQGRGTGRFVIDQLTRAMKSKGATALRLNVNRHNPAINFYEKLGFIVLQEEDIDIGNNYWMNDYVMQKDI
jgi:RsiW-degrading membrane proteinase PrsW (M82 family)/ribosomal protein S18 acetylase RimI-like enzyme